jgi:glycosyltransferase involved in cell wall biosynthesis
MKIFYWGPYISKVATVKAIIESAKSLKKYSKKKVNLSLIDAFGEWSNFKNDEINIINLNKKKFQKNKEIVGFIKSRYYFFLIWFISFFSLLNLLKKEKPNFLIIHLITSLPLFLLLFFSFETKFVLRISGYPKLTLIRKILWKLVSKKIFKVTCPTLGTYNKLKSENIFNDKLIFIPDPILNINDFKIKKNEDIEIEKNFSKKNSILSIGRLTQQKNFGFLIKSFKTMLEKYPNLNLFIIGEGEKKNELIELINLLDLKDKVFLIGYKYNVYKYLIECKCFILSSLWEDPGFVLVEAGISNATVLSSNCNFGPSEILQKGQNGFLFSSQSESSLIDSFDKFMNSKDDELIKKKIYLKKNIKKYTSYNHFKLISKIFDS